MRRGISMIELAVSVALGVLVVGAAGALHGHGRQAAGKGAAVAETAGGLALAQAMLEEDLERLVVRPHNDAVAISPDQQGLAFWAAKRPDSTESKIRLEPVRYRFQRTDRGAGVLFRNGQAIAGPWLAEVFFRRRKLASGGGYQIECNLRACDERTPPDPQRTSPFLTRIVTSASGAAATDEEDYEPESTANLAP